MPSMLYVGLQDADKIAVLSIDDSGKFSKQSEAAAANYRRAARADNTRRAYRAAGARFTEWCAVHRQTAVPASPQTVAVFLAAEAGKGLASTPYGCATRRCAICTSSPATPPPTASPLVAATFAGIRRDHRRPLRKKTALVVEFVARGLTGRSPTPCPGCTTAPCCSSVSRRRCGPPNWPSSTSPR